MSDQMPWLRPRGVLTTTTSGATFDLLLLTNRNASASIVRHDSFNTLNTDNCQVLELSRCSITDSEVSVLCEGLADERCHLRALKLAGNIDIGDRGATGGIGQLQQ